MMWDEQAEQKRALRDECRMPGHYYIDIGNYCNLRCPFCVTGAKASQTPQGFMTLDSFRVIFDKIRDHARLIALYNWGEPLMNKDFLDIVRLAASNGAKVHIDTNLSLHDLTDSYCEEIIASGLHSLFASIDGVSQAAYETYRVRGRIARVFANLERLVAAKARLNADHFVLGWQYHVSAFNEHEMAGAAQKAADLGIGIVFKRLNSPDPAWRSSLHEQAQMVLQGAAWFNQAYTPPQNPDFQQIRLHPVVAHPCGQLFGTMTVSWNGDVMPCTCVEGPSYAMGNLLHSTLAEVWNGDAFRASRDFVLNYGPEQSGCSVCQRLTCPIYQKHVSGEQTVVPVEAG